VNANAFLGDHAITDSIRQEGAIYLLTGSNLSELSLVRITVAYFAKARECAGTGEEELELSQPASIQQVLSTVMTIHPSLNEIKQSLRLLVNGKWASEETTLKDGDRVALLPPVGGG